MQRILASKRECSFNVEVIEFHESFPLACQDTLHVSVVFECEAVITADMLLEGDHYGCYDDYEITFTDPNVVFENVVLVAGPHIGEYLEACITDPENGNFCCSQLLIEDKLPPALMCSDTILDCFEDIAPHAIPHFPVPDNAVVTQIGTSNRYRVTGIDNCGSAIISYTDQHDLHMCDGEYSDIITRTWVAVDESGHTVTCTEQIFLLRGTIDDFIFPADTTIYCGNACIRPDSTPDHDCIGSIVGPFCGTFFIGYIDKVIDYCGGSYAVKREWTLVDWCNGDIIDYEQIINVADTTPPVVYCDELLEIGASFGKCGATVHVTPPVAFDECNSVPLTYTLLFGTEIILPDSVGEYVLPSLGLGYYDITWQVRDACGNLSTCTTTIHLFDDTPPVAYCDKHTVIAINNQDPMGVALLPASVLDDGSFDNCGPVTFRARRMDSCIDFDWTTNGHIHTPDGDVDNFDKGLNYNEFVPVSCCDADQEYILVQLEVRDLQGNVNYCMVEVQVQDKLAPLITCPPDITISCDFWFDVNALEQPGNRIFGTVVDGFIYDETARQPIIINDPGNPTINQPHYWGIDGYVSDNCNLELDIRVTVEDDCSGDDLPGNAPDGAVKLIKRRFTATDPAGRVGFCTQQIWVVNFDPFYINNNNPQDPTDDVIWPADIELTTCAIPDTIYPIILNDQCATVGINLKERRFEHTDGFCVKILRDWTIIDWCQYNSQTGEGLWKYTQVVKIKDTAGVVFTDCQNGIRVICDTDEGVTPVIDPDFETSCFVHLDITKEIEDICSQSITYDVKIYPPGSSSFLQAVAPTDLDINVNGKFDLRLNTANSPNLTLRNYGLELNDPNNPNEYYRILWTVIDGCGTITTCEEKVRIIDCKQPSPVCINGLSTVPMPSTGNITIWAKDFDASSFDNCTPADELRFSFSGTFIQPSKLFTCDDIIALGVEIPVEVWVWDNYGNKDYCSTTIVFTDPSGVCGFQMSGVSGTVTTPIESVTVANVGVHLILNDAVLESFTTSNDGSFIFPVVPAGHEYTLEADRNDDPRNGVTTFDLLRLQKHILGSEQFTNPYQYIAADANNSENVSAIDLIEIRKLILGHYTHFPNNRSWRFIPVEYVFQDPYHPWPFEESSSFMVDSLGVIEDFLGVKVGDLNQSVEAHFNIIKPRSTNSALMISDDQYVSAGDVIEVKFGLKDFNDDLLGGQWDMNLNGVKVISVIPATEGMTEEMWRTDETSFRVSWTSKEQVKSNHLFSLKLEASKSGMISEMISMDNSFLNSEIYDENDEQYNLGLTWRNAGQQENSGDIQLHQNKPNPWQDETIIPFILPEAGEATLSITNAIGEEVTSNVRYFSSGQQQFKISNEGWPAGLYYYTLRFGDTQLTKTMLILNKR